MVEIIGNQKKMIVQDLVLMKQRAIRLFDETIEAFQENASDHREYEDMELMSVVEMLYGKVEKLV